MSYISTMAKLNIPPDRIVPVNTNNRRTVSYKRKTIATSEETTFGGSLYLCEEQYKKAMALSEKMKNMNAW